MTELRTDNTNANKRCDSGNICVGWQEVGRGYYARLPYHYCLACLVRNGTLNEDGSFRRHAREIDRFMARAFREHPPFGAPYPTPSAGLTTDAAARKAAPIASGVVFYFPNALAAVANLSKVGNEQHNPGQPMHWAFDKDTDEPDCILRHLAQSGTVDSDGILHSVKVAWRALAMLERELLATRPELHPGKNVRGARPATGTK